MSLLELDLCIAGLCTSLTGIVISYQAYVVARRRLRALQEETRKSMITDFDLGVSDNFTHLIGLTLTNIEISRRVPHEDDYVVFVTDTGERYRLIHEQECCERVFIQDVQESIEDVLHTPIVHASKIVSPYVDPYGFKGFLYLFLLRTDTGTLHILFQATSCGCDFLNVDFWKENTDAD